MSQEDAVFLVAPSTFDPFVVQLFLALSTGARLVVVSEKLKMIPSTLCRILFDRQKVTVFQVSHLIICALVLYSKPKCIQPKRFTLPLVLPVVEDLCRTIEK